MSVSKLILKVCTSYSEYFNLKYERVGPLFQDSFKAVKVETDSCLLRLSAYIHQNPVVAGLVKDLNDYSYGSYLDYAGLRNGILSQKELVLGMFKNIKEYLDFVNQSYDKIRECKDLEQLLLD